jgi:hypothetical protein
VTKPPRVNPGRDARLRLGWLLCLALALCGCNEPPISLHKALSVKAADRTLEQIPAHQVTGTVYGAPFQAADARVRVQTMPGRQRLDLLLSDIPIERCGLPLASKGRRVWLRLPGTPKLDGSPLRAELGQTDLASTHYELLIGGQWLGHAGGAVLLGLRASGFGRYAGALWTCFDDDKRSCVTGRFEATACRSELDVDDDVWGSARLDGKYPERSSR